MTVERDGVSVVQDARFLLVGTMNPEEGELRPQLLDRFGLTAEVAAPRDPARRVEVVRRRMAFDADPDGWQVHQVPGGTHEGPAVEASAELLLEAASGRVNPVPAVARRQLKVHDVGGLLQLAPIVQKVPGIPGGPILQLAARTMGGAGSVLGRFFGRG